MVADAIGPYRIGRKLQSTGLGVQYEAAQQDTQKPVLLLLLRAEYTREPGLLMRLLTEARGAEAVDHPCFVPVADHGELPDGTVYLVYELGAGETLRQQLRRLREPMSVARVVHLGRQLAEALSAAHARGLVHRDLQPQHILLLPDKAVPGGEQVKLLDFGITNFAERWQATVASAQSEMIAIVGNPTYMSPEQCSGSGIVDDKTDVYSLGVILYHMLAARPPFAGEGYGTLIGQHLFKEVPSLAQAAPSVPAELADLIERMLIKQRERRPSMQQVVSAFTQLPSYRAGLPPAPRPQPAGSSLVNPFGVTGRFSEPLPEVPPRPTPAPPARPRRWPVAALVAVAVGVPLLAGLGWGLARRGARPPVSSARFAGPAAIVASSEPSHALVIPAPPPSAPPPPPPVAPRTTVQKVRWQLDSDPSGATVLRADDNLPLGTTPWTVEQPAEDGLQAVRLRMAGYADTRILLDRSESSAREVTLMPLPSPAKRPVVSELKRRPVVGPAADKPASTRPVSEPLHWSK
jgi:serine/threonine protein kinase